MRSLCGMLRKRPRGLRKLWLKCWQPRPTVGRVDDREHLFEVPHQQGVEEHLVGVLEPAQEHVAFEVVRELAHGLQAARDLLLEGGDDRAARGHADRRCRAPRR